MKILLLGAGLQGQAALYDLVRQPDVETVIAVDVDVERLRRTNTDLEHPKVIRDALDADDASSVLARMKQAEAVICLLPARFRAAMARLAVEAGSHFVDASYAPSEYAALGVEARKRGLAILPEFGLDPGLDLVLTGRAVQAFDTVTALYSYGAGIPEPDAADNPLKYRISWSFSGVLNAYTRPAQVVQDGVVREIPGDRLFAPENVHAVHVDGLGELEAYPNGDAMKYVELLGLQGSIREAGRFSMRWPGHSEIWRTLTGLGLLSDEPVEAAGARVSPRRFLHDLLYPQLQYGPGQRDIALIRVVVEGLSAGRRTRVTCQVLDYRDLETGLLAMQRTVGFTASIGAQMLLRGDITKRGLLSPLHDVPAEKLLVRLKRLGVEVLETRESAA